MIVKSGFLLIDKPEDWTSHDVVVVIRNKFKTKENKRLKVGHAGTLDPFATGLLLVGVGRAATRRIDEFKGLKKEYIAEVQLGFVSNTQDRTGEIEEKGVEEAKNIRKEALEELLKRFVGEQSQIPPMFSAKKIKGKKLYELARKGEVVEREPNQIEIYELELLSFDQSTGTFQIRALVSVGTYIRTLAHDIGESLGVGAYCKELRRTKIGDFDVKKAKGAKEVEESDIFDIE